LEKIVHHVVKEYKNRRGEIESLANIYTNFYLHVTFVCAILSKGNKEGRKELPGM
jgi:hypothetical protein